MMFREADVGFRGKPGAALTWLDTLQSGIKCTVTAGVPGLTEQIKQIPFSRKRLHGKC